MYWKDENAVAALPERDMVTTAPIGEMAGVRVGKAVYPAQVVAIGELIVCVHSCTHTCMIVLVYCYIATIPILKRTGTKEEMDSLEKRFLMKDYHPDASAREEQQSSQEDNCHPTAETPEKQG